MFSTGQFHLNTDGEGALLASFKYRNLKLFSYTSVYGFSSHHPPRTPAPAPRRVDQHQARRACAVQCCTTSPRPGLYPAWSPAQLPRRRGRQRRRSGGCRWRARGKSGAPPLCLHEAANPGLRGQEGGGRRASAKTTSLCHLPQQVLPGPAVHLWMSRSHFSAGGSPKKRRFLLGSGSGSAPKRNARTTMYCGFCEPLPTFSRR